MLKWERMQAPASSACTVTHSSSTSSLLAVLRSVAAASRMRRIPFSTRSASESVLEASRSFRIASTPGRPIVPSSPHIKHLRGYLRIASRTEIAQVELKWERLRNCSS